MRPARLAVVLLAATALTPAAPAGAAVRAVGTVQPVSGYHTSFDSFAGPVLAGGRVTWAERRGGGWLVRSAGAGTVAVLPALDPELLRLVSLTGSPAALGLTDSASVVVNGHDMDYEPRVDRALAGPVGEPPRALAGCGLGLGACPPGRCFATPASAFRVLVGTSASAIIERCVLGSRVATVLDLATRRERFSVALAPGGIEAMAGERLALGADDGVRVIDARTGGEVYRLSLPAGARLGGLAVQADGTVALTTVGRDPTLEQLAWASPREPVPHPLGGLVTYAGVRIAAGRILAHAQSGTTLTGRLTLYRLGGGSVVLARERLTSTIGAIGAVDLDAHRATWASGTCDGVRLLVEDDVAHASAARARTERCATFRVRGTRLRVAAARRVRVTLACPTGCSGRVELTTRGGDQLPAVARVRHPRPSRRVVVTVPLRRGQPRTGPVIVEFHGRDGRGRHGGTARHTSLI